MNESKDFKKGIHQLEWDRKRMMMQMEDLHNKARHIQMLKLTKDLQAVSFLRCHQSVLCAACCWLDAVCKSFPTLPNNGLFVSVLERGQSRQQTVQANGGPGTNPGPAEQATGEKPRTENRNGGKN